jgi:hypothetical protein
MILYGKWQQRGCIPQLSQHYQSLDLGQIH